MAGFRDKMTRWQGDNVSHRAEIPRQMFPVLNVRDFHS
jgi:hypothetical protein